MDQETGYQPIACDFHDRLEAFASLRRRVRLSLRGEAATAEGLITDIYTTADKQEFLRLDNGAEFRLDRIQDVAPTASASPSHLPE
jgi:transcriptional antiterminator Rof (Rho-off)